MAYRVSLARSRSNILRSPSGQEVFVLQAQGLAHLEREPAVCPMAWTAYLLGRQPAFHRANFRSSLSYQHLQQLGCINFLNI